MITPIENRKISIKQNKLFQTQSDIYTGEEIMKFSKRHPIYKALLKLEFENVLRKFQKI